MAYIVKCVDFRKNEEGIVEEVITTESRRNASDGRKIEAQSIG